MHFHVGSFGCGVSFSLILLYIGSIHRIEILRNNVFEGDSSIENKLESGHNGSFSNETLVASPEQTYSVRDHVANSTFGVREITFTQT